MQPIINRLSKEHRIIKVIRAKINLYPYQNEHMKSAYHIDQAAKHKVLLLSINTNNGYTEFENGSVFNAVENNAIIFDGNEYRSVSQTDHSVKININVNYMRWVIFCIGNGESRKNFDLERLRPFGKIYGCNGLYRDFTPDISCNGL